jgi:hypothetical protein
VLLPFGGATRCCEVTGDSNCHKSQLLLLWICDGILGRNRYEVILIGGKYFRY